VGEAELSVNPTAMITKRSSAPAVCGYTADLQAAVGIAMT
jgi:hypothetical protein